MAFLLVALQHRMPVYTWIGSARVDLIHECAPWALPVCIRDLLRDAILCRTVVNEEIGLVQVRRVIETADALAANQYVACHPCPRHHDESSHVGGVREDGRFIEDMGIVGYYRSVGELVVHTARRGDCAFDVACLMAGEPRAEAKTRESRFEVAD